MLTKYLVIIVTLTLLLIVINPIFANEFSVEWELENLDAPESVLYDNQHDVVFLSNVHGAPDDKDGKGYISVLSLTGEIKNKHWVSGLNAPKGLGRYKHLLYVADIDRLIQININNGRIERRYYSANAKFLNDVIVASNGDVYVSDMVTNTIYRLANDEFTIWLQSDELENPNGLYIEDNHIIVGSWGKMTDGFNTEVPGHLKSVSINDKQIKSLGNAEPVGNLDGVEADGSGNFYVTDWLNGGLFLISKTGEATKLLELPQGSADHDVILQKNLILIPKMLENKLTAYQIN